MCSIVLLCVSDDNIENENDDYQMNDSYMTIIGWVYVCLSVYSRLFILFAALSAHPGKSLDTLLD